MKRLEWSARLARSAAEAEPAVAARWNALRTADISDSTLSRARIVTRDKRNGLASPFDFLRTRILRRLHEWGATSVGITSPTAGCGKTLTCLNLAFSFARRPEGRTLAVELDLARPEMAHMLKTRPSASISDFLTGATPLEDVFLRAGDRLAIGMSAGSRPDSAELLQSAACADALLQANAALAPDVVLYDLPPFFAADDALAFASKVDCFLVVAAEGQSALNEVEECVFQLSQVTEVLGVALNKSAFQSRDTYGYYGTAD